MAQIIILEHHPMDCRIKIAQDQNHIQTLSERMGTGGGNVPMILEPIPLEDNGARPSHHGDGYRKDGPMYSLNTTEVHSVAYAFEPGILKREGKENRVCEEVTPTIREHMGDNQTAVAYTVDMGGGKSSVCTYQEQWSANRSNTNDEQCRGGATNAGQR